MTLQAGEQVPGVTIAPVGGFGNQVFIYAAGFAVAHQLGCPLYIDASWFKTQSLRRYELDTFASEGSLLPEVTRSTLFTGSRPRKYMQNLLVNYNVPLFKSFKEKRQFIFDSNIFLTHPGVKLEGYFQSYKYFQDVGDIIGAQVRKINAPSPWFVEMQSALASVGSWISVHVRRGDYLNKGVREIHGVVPRSYYVDALNLMDKAIPGSTPVVFSDDLDFARRMLGNVSPRSIFVENPAASKSVESVVLMSQSNGSILANSSFSWWGAWLGNNDERPVIAPRPWMEDDSFHERDLFPLNWLTLGRE